MKVIKVGDGEYEIASEELRLAVGYIHQVWVDAGKPNRLEGESAWKVMDAFMQMWASLYPWEIRAFKESIVKDRELERTPREANKHEGGHIPISYPTRLYQLIKLYFPTERLVDRKLIRKFVQRYPILKVTKYAL